MLFFTYNSPLDRSYNCKFELDGIVSQAISYSKLFGNRDAVIRILNSTKSSEQSAIARKMKRFNKGIR